MIDQTTATELRSRFKALVCVAGLFIFFLVATAGVVLYPTEWGQRFANTELGMDALHLTFGFLVYGALTLGFSVLTVITGGALFVGGYRLYVDRKACQK